MYMFLFYVCLLVNFFNDFYLLTILDKVYLLFLLLKFTFFTIISLIFTKPLLDKFINKNVTKTNIDMIIGKIGIVTKEINELSPGRVKVSGKDWMAISNSHIDEGKKVRVLKIEGAKIIVREEER